MYGARLGQKLKTVLEGSPQYLSQRPYPQPLRPVYQSIDLLRTQVETVGACDPSGAVASDFLVHPLRTDWLLLLPVRLAAYLLVPPSGLQKLGIEEQASPSLQ